MVLIASEFGRQNVSPRASPTDSPLSERCARSIEFILPAKARAGLHRSYFTLVGTRSQFTALMSLIYKPLDKIEYSHDEEPGHDKFSKSLLRKPAGEVIAKESSR